jgi:site-specific DNA-methyltransferase (adenine-specific)
MSCSRKIGPYNCCSVVEGDCLELMKALPDGCVDAVITDPPYGIGYVHGDGGGCLARSTRFNRVSVFGDDRPFDPQPWLRFPVVVLWGANHYASKLPDSSAWLTWDKREGMCENDQADCEMAWTNLKRPARLIRHYWNGMLKASERGEERQHPTQKPIAVMEWCIRQAGECETVLDPYAGSGSTLVAAAKLGRHFLGFEISPAYVEIARKRIALVEAQPNLFQPKAEQLELGGGQ